MAKLKYWRFWVSDFYGSARVRRLSGTVRRIYLELLAFEAEAEGIGLPGSHNALAKMLDLTNEEFENAWRTPEDPCGVSQFFSLDAGGMYRNSVCEGHLSKDMKNAETFKRRGKAGAERRWNASSNASSNASRYGIAQMSDESLLVREPDENKRLEAQENLEPLNGGTAENSALRQEGHYNPARRELLVWLRKHGITRPDTTEGILGTGLSLSDLPAWEAFRLERGEAAFNAFLKSHKNPSTVPAAVKKETFEERRARERRARAEQIANEMFNGSKP